MRISTARNIENRLYWLEGVLDRKISISDSIVPSLKTMRSFCALSVKGHFSPIAYNTLRNAAINTDTHPERNKNWDYLVTLRAKCYETFRKVELQPSSSTLESRHTDAQSLLDAHICSMAYLEIYHFLEKLIAQPDQISPRTQAAIKNQLILSREKFQGIVSYKEFHSSPVSSLKLVDR